jgi:16S rRNA (uracil1498-N3)-methyltransferase
VTIRLILEIEPRDDAQVCVSGSELGYLCGVRRARRGELVEILSHGTASLAKVEQVSAKAAVLRIVHPCYRVSPPLEVELAVSVPKRQLMEDIVRFASELGVRTVTPLLLERTVVEPGQGKLDRWRNVAQESMRQCGRTEVLKVDEPMGLLAFLAQAAVRSSSRFVLHPEAQRRFPWRAASAKGVCILVGPEGGLCEDELETAVQAGFVPVGLGQTVLRIETAAIAAAVLSAAAAGSWLEDVDYV